MNTPIPPQNLEAETSVLGAIVLENEVISRILETLSPEDFYRESHRQIFRAMMALSDQHEPIDLLTLSEILKARGELEGVGGSAYIASFVETVPTAVNVESHARIVREASNKRKLLSALREAEEELCSSAEDFASVAGRLSTALSRLQSGGSKSFVPMEEVVLDTLKRIERRYERYKRGSLVTGIPTGFRELDNALGGIHPGELFIIAGRPSMGKTALAAGVARGAAERGFGVAFVTAESPAPEIVQRLMAEATGIENRNLRRGKLDERDFGPLVARAGVLGKLPIWWLDSDRGWDRIKAKIRALKLRVPALSLIVLDYVGLISAPVPKGERYLEIGRISSEAKSLAMELAIGFVLLSQLNRDLEARPDKRPKLSDLRESGNLEQDADVVGLLFRPHYYDKTFKPADQTELIIAKARNGDTGALLFRFNDLTTSFHDWTEPSVGRDYTEEAVNG